MTKFFYIAVSVFACPIFRNVSIHFVVHCRCKYCYFLCLFCQAGCRPSVDVFWSLPDQLMLMHTFRIYSSIFLGPSGQSCDLDFWKINPVLSTPGHEDVQSLGAVPSVRLWILSVPVRGLCPLCL